MFNKDFYPTPDNVIESMGIDCMDKIILEPSAGKGNIIEWLKNNGAKQVLSCEINKDLAEIVKSKSKFLQHDFLQLQPEEISHINLIVMNPPFSKGVKHLLHAWTIAPDGCEIISLINYESMNNDYSRERRELKTIIENYGTDTNLGNVFFGSERKTGVEIGLIKLFKPLSNNREFEGFFMDEDIEQQGNGIMPYNSIREVVQRYINSVKKFEEILVLSAQMNELNTPFNIGGIVCEIGYNESVCDKETYKKELQKKAWQYLFGLMKMDKYVTSGVMKDINSFVENQTKVPFTMKNIYRMFEIIVGTREQTFNKSLCEAIDHFTMHTDENRYNVEGWKTNSGYLLNKKFIVPYMVEKSFNKYLTTKYNSYTNNIEDLIKVLCSIRGENYDKIPKLSNYCRDIKMQPNTWYEFSFFMIKGFLKGTMHFKFKDDKVWENVNRAYAKIKGQVLPEKI